MGPLTLAMALDLGLCGSAVQFKAALESLPQATVADVCDLVAESERVAPEFKLKPQWLLRLVHLESSGRRVHVVYPKRWGWTEQRTDFGWFQIHSTTAKAFNCDTVALAKFDVAESVRCAAKVLADARTRCAHSGKAWVGCYHSTTPWRRDAYAHKFWGD